MIATNEAADVLRHGWQDAASTLAADIPEVGELLQARLEMAIASQRLDERHLLDTIEEVESISSRAGSPASDALALRLRRTVYEFLLALDATRQTEHKTLVEQSAVSDGPMVGAEEVAALGHPTLLRGSGAQASPAEPAEAPGTMDQQDTAAAPALDVSSEHGDAVSTSATGRRFALRHKQRQGDAAAGEPDGALEANPGEPVAAATEEAVEAAAETGVLTEADGQAADGEGAADPSTTAFMAPKAGFHIGDDGVVVPGAGGGDDARLTMPVFAADELVAAEENSEFLTWRHAARDIDNAGEAPAAAGPPASPPPQTLPATLAQAAQASPPHAGSNGSTILPIAGAELGGAAGSGLGDEDDDERGWRVRRPGEAHTPRSVPAAKAEEDPFEGNAKLTETRRRIEDRLRRKRCDEAAALLQALALETGGRHVAELAMNAGDRCRALGKSNAALNCYLAASRSDPVYELPLSRLADICIDDKETDLAVSYLERIARLYRFRGDEVAALRVYRRIATIAPYREDVLNMLMQAQRTGRLEA